MRALLSQLHPPEFLLAAYPKLARKLEVSWPVGMEGVAPED